MKIAENESGVMHRPLTDRDTGMLRRHSWREIFERPIGEIRAAVDAFLGEGFASELLIKALRVRAVENVLLSLFRQGRLHGTIHSCSGQELIGITLGENLEQGDFVTSNHRCHGHFIGATAEWRGLIDEIVGNADGVSRGVGGSQHLWAENFLSNGQQGGLLPVAAGIALDRKLQNRRKVVVSFIGEGTLGEGIVYEVLNLASLWCLPLVIVCENNFYSQSTPQDQAVAGDIVKRALAFGWSVRNANVWQPATLASEMGSAVDYARNGKGPVFILVEAYRLDAHSKGDDTRPEAEVAGFRKLDPLNVLMESWPSYGHVYRQLESEIREYAAVALNKGRLSLKEYLSHQVGESSELQWRQIETASKSGRIGPSLAAFYSSYLAHNANGYLIGEDISDPYGGAFKITKGISSRFPDRVFSTPISEAAIVGTGIGLALAGNRPIVEIMFGDFASYAFDQLLNNASKFGKMYGRPLNCPLIVRTPMGGGRGYGPTHSQSLERHFVGMDGCEVVNIHSFLPVASQLHSLLTASGPTVIFENKVDYANTLFEPPRGYVAEASETKFPSVVVRPAFGEAALTIASYGGVARLIGDHLLQIVEQCDTVSELIILGRIYPFDPRPILESVAKTHRLLVVEEGVAFAGIGAEIIAQIVQKCGGPLRVIKIGREEVPIPASPALEDLVLPNIPFICSKVRALMRD